MCACSSVDRALASGARGHRFKSCQAHQVFRFVIRGGLKSEDPEKYPFYFSLLTPVVFVRRFKKLIQRGPRP
jgi:hypothetical protein